jgi:hypothetical protein
MNEKEMRHALANARPAAEILEHVTGSSLANWTVGDLEAMLFDVLQSERARVKQLERRIALLEAHLRRIRMDEDT